MLRFTVRQLEYFLAVAEYGAISAAAQELRVSATAIGAAINELERVMGSQLLIRRRAHGATLTATGRFLAAKARKLVLEGMEIELATESAGKRLRGPLSVGCYTTLAPTFLPELVAYFHEQHPDVLVDIQVGTQNEMQAMLGAGEVDIAVVYDMDLPTDLCTAHVDSLRSYALMSAQHPLALNECVTLQELSGYPMILLDAPPSREHTLSDFAREGLSPMVAYRVVDFELARSMAARGLGYAYLVQRPQVNASYEGTTVIAKDINPPVRAVDVKVAWSPRAKLSERALAALEFLQKVQLPAQQNMGDPA